MLSGFGSMCEATLHDDPRIILGAVNYAEKSYSAETSICVSGAGNDQLPAWIGVM